MSKNQLTGLVAHSTLNRLDRGQQVAQALDQGQTIEDIYGDLYVPDSLYDALYAQEPRKA